MAVSQSFATIGERGRIRLHDSRNRPVWSHRRAFLDVPLRRWLSSTLIRPAGHVYSRRAPDVPLRCVCSVGKVLAPADRATSTCRAVVQNISDARYRVTSPKSSILSTRALSQKASGRLTKSRAPPLSEQQFDKRIVSP